MNTPRNPKGAEQRQALKDSEKKASQQQPENFKEAENEEKVVEVLPIDQRGSSIKGLDPEKK